MLYAAAAFLTDVRDVTNDTPAARALALIAPTADWEQRRNYIWPQ
jgi:hypothetical protein